MTPETIGFIGLAVLLVFMFIGVPIAVCYIGVGFFGVWYILGGKAAFSALATIPYATMTNYTLTCIPMFVLMGFLAASSGLAEEFYEGCRRWVGQFRGGLASAMILANTGFGAATGDVIGAAASFTVISLPEMRKYRYADSLSLGCIAAGSILSSLIPPSGAFIIYGAITQTSIGKLLIAGILPGLLLASLYLVVIYIICRHYPSLGPPGPKTTFREKLRAGIGMWTLIFIFLIIIGGLYFGVFTPTEAGGAGASVVLLLGLIRRKISWHGFKNALIQTGLTVAMVGLLISGTLVFNLFLVRTGVGFAIGDFILGLVGSATGTLLIIVVIYLIMGMVIDSLAMILLTVPIFFPMLVEIGVNPIQFGVIALIMMGIGALTPPVGLVCYTISGVAKDVPLFTIFRGAAPFLVAMVVCAVLVIFIPEISLLLPNMMMS